MRRVALVGAGLTRFGVREAGFRELIAEAGQACFDETTRSLNDRGFSESYNTRRKLNTGIACGGRNQRMVVE